jgi:hypothetical protein
VGGGGERSLGPTWVIGRHKGVRPADAQGHLLKLCPDEGIK